MSFDASRIARLRSALDEDEALALLRRAIGAASVTGEEKAFAELLAEELNSLGASNVTLKEFAPGRPNVGAELRGEGGGPRLLLTGHTDTVHVRGWAERWAGTERADPFGGAVVDGEIWGRGAGDLKAGICTTLAAARLVRKAGLPLPARNHVRLRRRRGKRRARLGRQRGHEGVRRGGCARAPSRGPISRSMSSRRGSTSTPPRWGF